MNTILSALAVAAAVYLGVITPTHEQPIDEIIGEGSYNTVIPVAPGDRASIDRQLTHRLERIERLLRGRDVSEWSAGMQAAREKTLRALHAYWTVGVYSTNYDHPDQFLPCFMDRDGGYCAVAFLMAQSGDIKLAEEINRDYQYATIAEMRSPKLEDWVARSGLTRAEVITIQEPEFTSRGWFNRIFVRDSSSVIVHPVVAQPVGNDPDFMNWERGDSSDVAPDLSVEIDPQMQSISQK